MTTGPVGRPTDRHFEVERQLVDAEIELAKQLEELGEVEARMGMKTDADRRLEQAAELDKRAGSQVEHLRHELEEVEKGRDSDLPPRRPR